MRWWLAIAAVVGCGKHVKVVPRAAGDQIAIVTMQPGATAVELETDVAAKIANAVRTIPHVEHVRTTAAEGSAKVELELDDGVDASAVAQDVQTRLTPVLRELPAGIMPPMVMLEPPSAVALRYTLRSSSLSRTQLTELHRRIVEPAIERTSGVLRIDACGEQAPRILVELDPLRLTGAGLALGDVTTALRGANLSLPSGGPDVDGLAKLVIATIQGAPVRLLDIARIATDGEPPTCRANDERGGVISAAVVMHARGARDELEEALAGDIRRVRAELPQGTVLELQPAGQPAVIDADLDGDHAIAGVLGALREMPHVSHLIVEAGASSSRILVYPGDAGAEAIAALRQRGLSVRPPGDVIVQILGPDREQLQQLAKAVAAAIRARTDVTLTAGVGLTMTATMRVEPDRATATRLGVALRDVEDALRAATAEGLPVTTAFRQAGEWPVVVAISGGRAQLMETYVRSTSGTVPIASLARAEQHAGLSELLRDDGEPYVGVGAIGEPGAILDAIKSVAMPAGYRVRLIAGGP